MDECVLMDETRTRGRRLAAMLLCFLCLVVCAVPARADDGGFYVGVDATLALYEADYLKAVDSRSPANVSANAGRILFSAGAADSATMDAGPVVGFRFALPAVPLYLEVEGDLMTHRGDSSGRLAGTGRQLGDVWPESWSLAKDRSYGLTVRVGTELPGLGASIFAFGGVRRVDATFKTSYSGCLLVDACDAGQITYGQEQHDEEFDAWVAGVGLEKTFASLSLRGQLRYVDHGTSERVVRFDQVAVVVPVTLETRELGVSVGLIWRP